MFILVILVLGVVSIASARPNEVSPQNVITVPPNCPEGQEWINGQCRDIWKSGSITPSPLLQMYGNNVDSKNMITVPSNCPPGQQIVNGICREIWRGGAFAYGNNVDSKNMITVPSNCPPGQQIVNGICREIWRRETLAESKFFEKFFEKQLAMSDFIRDSRQAEDEIQREGISETYDSSRNIINVPSQCPKGYRRDALGICRKIF